MCGFLYINDIKSINKNYLEDAKNRLSLRGPDFQKSEIINNHLFFHSRLSIQGLDNKANQPFFSKDKKYIMVKSLIFIISLRKLIILLRNLLHLGILHY